jgi:uncharacterized protein YndB with AHSA1/START domain
MNQARVRFPPEFSPLRCPVHSYNEIVAPVAPEKVWAALIRAEQWPTWYPHCKRLKFESGSGPDLALGTRFSWSTLGVRVTTTVEEFEPPHRLAWRGAGAGSAGYHGWVIAPRADGTLVVTEESQHGLVSSLGRFFLRRALLHVHQIWLERLVAVAGGGRVLQWTVGSRQ